MPPDRVPLRMLGTGKVGAVTAPPTPRILPPEERALLLPYRDRTLYKGRCIRCGGALPPRKRSWCGDLCMAAYFRAVGWTTRARIVDGASTYTCAICGALVRGDELEVDHKVPLALGGSHAEKNLQPLCRPCHLTKTAKDRADIAAAHRPDGPTGRRRKVEESHRLTRTLDGYGGG